MKKENLGLGRVYIADERDSNFPMQALLPAKATSRTFKYWWSGGWWGNQESLPHCVAYAWIHWLEDGGVTQNHKAPPVMIPKTVYDASQRVDQWVGESYDGTSVRGGAKVLQQHGYIKEYRWTKNVEELIQAVLTTAPVVVGTHWYKDMFFPNSKGVIKATGTLMGGHAYLISGCNTKTKMFRIKNSWGRDWGNKGFAYISFEDMQNLLNQNGECCIAVEIRK